MFFLKIDQKENLIMHSGYAELNETIFYYLCSEKIENGLLLAQKFEKGRKDSAFNPPK